MKDRVKTSVAGSCAITCINDLSDNLLSIANFFSDDALFFVVNESKYSRMDQLKFVEGSL